jgi:hypothetical protein
MSEEYDGEPIRGLPAKLPAGESILWQGAPDFRALAVRALHLRAVSWYFAFLAVWGIETRFASGAPALSVALAILEFVALAVLAVALLALFAYLVVRTTVYTITTRRVVIRFGIALPITIQIPFKSVTNAGVKRFAGGAGDIALALQGEQKIGYAVLWPHARPWKFASAQPSFRAIANVDSVAALLGRALAASAEQTPQTLVVMKADAKRDGRLPATA